MNLEKINFIMNNVGKEKQKSTCFGIFYKTAYVQVMNYIPVKDFAASL
jgi:hypothetical protein